MLGASVEQPATTAAKLLNNKYRIILFDSDKHDRALLALALRSALPHAEVLEASTAVEVAHHVSAGTIDALVADPVARFGETISILLDLRKRYPACLCWLFSGEGSLPATRDCIGRGIDGRYTKTSAGFLDLPGAIAARLELWSQINLRLASDVGTVFNTIFPGATCLITEDGKLAMVSQEFERVVEQPRFELTGQTVEDFWLDQAKRDEWHARLARSPRSWDFVGRFRCPRADKPVMAMALRMVVSEPPGGSLWAATITDVSRVAAVASERRGEPVPGEGDNLIFALTHDLQAPLNSLVSHADSLVSQLGDDDEEIARTAREIGGLTQRMQDMIDSIADYAVPGAATDREIISLDEVLDDALSNLSSRIDESGATIEREPLPALAVSRAQMTQVFQNLIGNAIKFRGNRIPRIRIRVEQGADALRIRLEDNGIGIDPQEQENIFKMFYRLHTDDEYAGIGAGLAISRRIVRAHGGELSVDSEPGRGSTFTLEFRGAAVRNVGASEFASGSKG